MSRLLGELRLGAECALSARGPRLRTALTAAGVALGVAVLLLAASIPHAVAARDARVQANVWIYGAHPQLELAPSNTRLGSTAISGITVAPAGSHPPIPPGIARLPRPGTMDVSPALAKLLRGPRGPELSRRLGARVTGTIGRAGLDGPGDVRFIRGSTNLRPLIDQGPDVSGFGAAAGGAGSGVSTSSATAGYVTLLVIAIVVALLVPVGMFVATAARFGSEERERRLAAMRLVGAGASTTTRIAAGEALVGALGGLVLGGALFIALRPLAAHLSLIGETVFASDLVPSAWLAALIAVLVPLSAVIAALASIRTVIATPLGTSRRARPAGRRLAWRLVAPALGFALLGDLAGDGTRLTSTSGTVQAAAGMVLALVGLTALLPWVVEALVRRAPDGPLPWLLAIRRLRVEGSSTSRVVGAIGLAVAGAIALQIVFSAVAVQDRALNAGLAPAGTMSVDIPITTQGGGRAVIAALNRVPGVRSAAGAATSRQDDGATIADCATIVRYGGIAHCRDGDRFMPRGAALRRATSLGAVGVLPYRRVLLTPAAARHAHVTADAVRALVRITPGDQAAADRLRDRVAAYSPLASVVGLRTFPTVRTYGSLRHALLAGAIVVLGMIGASLLVAACEQLRERRRPLAVLAAFGARRSTLAWSVLWQAAIPVIAGLALALGVGAALGELLTAIVGLSATYDWGAIALMVGAGAAVIAAVTTLTMPTLARMMAPGGLRTE